MGLISHTPANIHKKNLEKSSVIDLTVVQEYSGVTIGSTNPPVLRRHRFRGRKIAPRFGTFLGKLNCCTSKSTRFRLEMYIYYRFLPFSRFSQDLIVNLKHLIKLPSWCDRGTKWATGALIGGAHTQRCATARIMSKNPYISKSFEGRIAAPLQDFIISILAI